jgi:hypothetical protein
MHCRTDFTGDGLPDIVVGRSNGDLEVWSMDEAREPKRVMSKTLNEAVQSLDTGFVCTSDTRDIVLQTFSGRVCRHPPPFLPPRPNSFPSTIYCFPMRAVAKRRVLAVVNPKHFLCPVSSYHGAACYEIKWI